MKLLPMPKGAMLSGMLCTCPHVLLSHPAARVGARQSDAVLAEKSDEGPEETLLHPTFPGDGILFLGQEQETICGGFDDYDSLSADVSEFQASVGQVQGNSSPPRPG